MYLGSLSILRTSLKKRHGLYVMKKRELSWKNMMKKREMSEKVSSKKKRG
jgi:hypothetical protein